MNENNLLEKHSVMYDDIEFKKIVMYLSLAD